MLNNKDPLIAAVQKVMQDSYAERNAVKVVNEKFGVVDRRVLPHERQGEWDAAYKTVLSEGVKALDEKLSPAQKHHMDVDDDNDIDSKDLEMKRMGMKEEGDPSKAIRGDVVTGSSSVTTAKPSINSRDQKDLKNLIIKKAMTIKEAKKAATLESIQEEISNNLAEQAASIYESEGQEGLDIFLESLSEEQMELLQINERAAGGFVQAMQKTAQAAAKDTERRETTAKLNAPGAKGPNAAAGYSPARPQVAAKATGTSKAIQNLNTHSAPNPQPAKKATVKPKPKPAAPVAKPAAPKAASAPAPKVTAKPKRPLSRTERDDGGRR
jgi:hypothetical protein